MKQLGNYKIIKEIGRGAMGIVYEAHQITLNRSVALKILPSIFSAKTSAIERFKREAESASKLQHPGIVQIYDVGKEDNTYFFAMELVKGSPLDEILDNERLSFERCAEIIIDVAEALEYAHQNGVIHRDIKPSNIMITTEGKVKITDFGLAKIESSQTLTQTGDMMGTPMYMSPEQIFSKKFKPDHRTDIYSLGATFYEVLTLEQPFEGEDIHTISQQILNKEPRNLRKLNTRIPKDLETICLKSMEKELPARYQTAQEFADDIKRFLEYKPILAKPVGILGKTMRFIKRNKVISFISFLSLFFIIILSVYFIKNQAIEKAKRTEAEQARQQLIEERKLESKREWQLVFSDNFDRNEIGENWFFSHDSHKNNWRIEDGFLIVSSEGGNSFILVNNDFSGSIKVEFDAYATYTDPNGQINCFINGLDRFNSYMFAFGGWDNTKTAIEKNGNIIVETTNKIVNKKTWYNIRIERVGNLLRYYINNNLIFEYIDDNPIIGVNNTKIGLDTWDSKEVKFNNFRIYTLGLPERMTVEDFANNLYEDGFYSAAINYFSNLLEKAAGIEKQQELNYKIALCYYNIDKIDTALLFLNTAIKINETSHYGKLAKNEYHNLKEQVKIRNYKENFNNWLANQKKIISKTDDLNKKAKLKFRIADVVDSDSFIKKISNIISLHNIPDTCEYKIFAKYRKFEHKLRSQGRFLVTTSNPDFSFINNFSNSFAEAVYNLSKKEYYLCWSDKKALTKVKKETELVIQRSKKLNLEIYTEFYFKKIIYICLGLNQTDEATYYLNKLIDLWNTSDYFSLSSTKENKLFYKALIDLCIENNNEFRDVLNLFKEVASDEKINDYEKQLGSIFKNISLSIHHDISIVENLLGEYRLVTAVIIYNQYLHLMEAEKYDKGKTLLYKLKNDYTEYNQFLNIEHLIFYHHINNINESLSNNFNSDIIMFKNLLNEFEKNNEFYFRSIVEYINFLYTHNEREKITDFFHDFKILENDLHPNLQFRFNQILQYMDTKKNENILVSDVIHLGTYQLEEIRYPKFLFVFYLHNPEKINNLFFQYKNFIPYFRNYEKVMRIYINYKECNFYSYLANNTFVYDNKFRDFNFNIPSNYFRKGFNILEITSGIASLYREIAKDNGVIIFQKQAFELTDITIKGE